MTCSITVICLTRQLHNALLEQGIHQQLQQLTASATDFAMGGATVIILAWVISLCKQDSITYRHIGWHRFLFLLPKVCPGRTACSVRSRRRPYYGDSRTSAALRRRPASSLVPQPG
jgi:hypothetical protein